MSSCGSLKECVQYNPFLNGLKHRMIEEGTLLSNCYKGPYYLGRAVRFVLSVPGTVVDLALQILQAIPLTAELLLLRLECSIRTCQPIDSCSHVIHQFGMSALIFKIRSITTEMEPSCLAIDLGIIDYKKHLNIMNKFVPPSFVNMYFTCLVNSLGLNQS